MYLIRRDFFMVVALKMLQMPKTMAAIADTVIVGNIIYDDLTAALATVDAVKSVSRLRTIQCIMKEQMFREGGNI